MKSLVAGLAGFIAAVLREYPLVGGRANPAREEISNSAMRNLCPQGGSVSESRLVLCVSQFVEGFFRAVKL